MSANFIFKILWHFKIRHNSRIKNKTDFSIYADEYIPASLACQWTCLTKTDNDNDDDDNNYRVVEKSGTPFLFCDNFRKYTPILTIFSLLEQEIYDA